MGTREDEDVRRLSFAGAPSPGGTYACQVFLLFGFGDKRKQLGMGQTRTCPRCHNTTQWARMKQYRQFTLFFIPVAKWKKSLFEQCPICGTVVEG